jgi:hypothetical protein
VDSEPKTLCDNTHQELKTILVMSRKGAGCYERQSAYSASEILVHRSGDKSGWANRIVLSNNFSHGLPLLFSDSGHLHLHPNSRACSDDD